jgi:hypothetical protein
MPGLAKASQELADSTTYLEQNLAKPKIEHGVKASLKQAPSRDCSDSCLRATRLAVLATGDGGRLI